MANRMQPSPARVMAQVIKAGEIVARALGEIERGYAELRDELSASYLRCPLCQSEDLMVQADHDGRHVWDCGECEAVFPRFIHPKPEGCGLPTGVFVDSETDHDALGTDYICVRYCVTCGEEYSNQAGDEVMLPEDEGGIEWTNAAHR